MSASTPRLQPASPLRRSGPLRVTVPARRHPDPDPLAVTRPKPPLRIVPRLRRRRAGMVAVSICVVVFGVMLALVAFQAKLAADQQRLDRIDQETSQAQIEYERLRVVVAQLESPYNIISSAERKGMVVPDTVNYVTPSVGDVAAVTSAGGRAPATATATSSHDATSSWEGVKPYVSGAP